MMVNSEGRIINNNTRKNNITSYTMMLYIVESLMGYCQRLRHRRRIQEHENEKKENLGSKRRDSTCASKGNNSSSLTTSRQFHAVRDSLLEHCISWTVVAVFGVRYIVDYTKLRIRLSTLRSKLLASEQKKQRQEQEKQLQREASQPQQQRQEELILTRIPLCSLTHTRSELEGISSTERWTNVKTILSDMLLVKDDSHQKPNQEQQQINWIVEVVNQIPDDDFVRYVHSSLELRRELSYAMRSLSLSTGGGDGGGGSTVRFLSRDVLMDDDDDAEETIILSVIQQFVDKIERLWPRFLELPRELVTTKATGYRSKSDATDSSDYKMSLIVPMYKEPFGDIVGTLRHAIGGGTRQASFLIEVILVHVVVVDDSRQQSSSQSTYTEQQFLDAIIGTTMTAKDTEQQQQQQQPNFVLKVVEYTGGGGRGPTLNFGFHKSHGQIVTFLHADTLIPKGWDVQIQNALTVSTSGSSSSTRFPTACAFVMGIDKSSSSVLPAAIRGAEWLGILRCYCGLPYGDSVLSFHRTFFEYVGGYPNQPLMEDYEIMDWLRTRSLLLKTKNDTVEESPVLIKTHQALCSPRRWAKHGVAYTSLVNALCIYRYRQLNIPSEDLFNFYYGQQQRPQNHRQQQQQQQKNKTE